MTRRQRTLATLLPAALLLPASSPAVATEPRAAAAGPVSIELEGRVARLQAPRQVPRGGRVRVRCGIDARGTRVVATASVRARPRQRLAVRLPRAVPNAEWCAYDVLDHRGEDAPGLPFGAGVLLPRVGPPPPPRVTEQTPGVRIGRTQTDGQDGGDDLEGDDGDATFLVAGSVLTVRLAQPIPRSMLLTLACAGNERPVAHRTIAVQPGRRILTADLGADAAAALLCLVEDDDGGDVFGAGLQPSGATPSQVPSAP